MYKCIKLSKNLKKGQTAINLMLMKMKIVFKKQWVALSGEPLVFNNFSITFVLSFVQIGYMIFRKSFVRGAYYSQLRALLCFC